MTSCSLKALKFSFAISVMFFSSANAETTQQRFQKAVVAKDCSTIEHLLPKLLRENKFYYNTLANYHERGFCFPKDDRKAFEAYSKASSDISNLPLFKMAMMYSEGRGVKKNVNKSKALIKRALEQEVTTSYDFNGIRGSLEFLLDTTTFPAFLEAELVKLESLEDNPDQKTLFALTLVKKSNDPKSIQAGINLLANLAFQKKYAEAAYQLALIEYSNKNDKDGFMTLLSAANKGHVKAQIMIGKLGFEGQKAHMSRASSYAMLLRAYSVGAISEKELVNYKKRLSSHELKSAEKEAAKPLPK